MAVIAGTGGGGAVKKVYKPTTVARKDQDLIPRVAPIVTPQVRATLSGVPAPSFTGSEPKVASAYQPVQTAGFQNVTGGASVTPATSTLPTGFGGMSAVLGPPAPTSGAAPGFAGVTGTAGVTPAPGAQPGFFTGAEPKATQYYQPPATAGTLPGAFTGSEPKAERYYQPPSTAGGGPGAGGAQQLTLADLGLQGKVTPNTLEGGRGWYLPWYSNGVQGSLDWSTGAFYPAYPLAGGGNAGGEESAGSGGGGGGGGSQPRAGGMVGGLVNWRIGT